MKLGLQLGYWQKGPTPRFIELAQVAESLGFDSVWTAEAYGSDCFTPLAWHGSQTRRMKLGTAVCQMSARTPVATAMAALTLDHLTEAEGTHDLADRDRRQVGRLFADPGPVGRIYRYPLDVNQGLTGSDLGNRFHDQVEGVLIDRSIRSFSEQETAVFVGHPPILPRPGRWPFTLAVRIGLPSVQEYLHCLSGNVGRSQ